jgi:hypothetical protein
MAAQVVVALAARDPSEHRVVRMPGAPEERQGRESDRDPDADQDAECDDAEERRDREPEVDAVDAAEPPQRGEVDEPDHSRHHDGRERRKRQVLRQSGAEHEHDASAPAAATPVSGCGPADSHRRGMSCSSEKPWKASRDGGAQR